MTVAEAARALEVSASTVYQLCRAGRLGHVRVGLGRGAIRISEGDIEAFRRVNGVVGQAPERTEVRTARGTVKIPDPFERLRRMEGEGRKSKQHRH